MVNIHSYGGNEKAACDKIMLASSLSQPCMAILGHDFIDGWEGEG